jgi:hypothetical protein
MSEDFIADPLVVSAYVTLRPHGKAARTIDIFGNSSLLLDVDADGRALGIETIGRVCGTSDLARLVLAARFHKEET